MLDNIDVMIATASMMDRKMSFDAFKALMNRDDIALLLQDAGIDMFQPKEDNVVYELTKTGTRHILEENKGTGAFIPSMTQADIKRNKKVDIPLESWQKHVERSIDDILADNQEAYRRITELENMHKPAADSWVHSLRGYDNI